MIASHSCCRFVGSTSMMWISRSTTSQRCSIALRSGDCGGHLSKVNSLSCSRDDLSFVTWCIILLEVASEDEYTVVIKGWTWSATILREAVVFKRCSIGTKCAKKISPTPLHHHHQPEPLRQGRTDPCFHVLYTKFWLYHLNVAAEIKTHQTRQHFSNLLLSNVGDPVWIVSSVSCS